MELRAARNLDAAHFRLWSDGYLAPRGDLASRRAPRKDGVCSNHADVLALGAAVAAIGATAGSGRFMGVGVVGLLLVAYLFGRGRWLESREKRAGQPSAMDR